MHEDGPYILHILDAVKNLQEACEKTATKEDFVKNEFVREYSARKIEIIGEASKHLSKELKAQLKNIPWNKISGMRDKLIHHYMGVDFNIVWDVIKSDIPELEKGLKKYLEEKQL